MKTLNQERSEYTLKKVLDIQGKDYSSFIAGTPSMILKNGFGHTLAFFLSKGKEEHKFVFNLIQNWLIDKEYIDSIKDNRDFMLKLSTINRKSYIEAQKETLLLLEWVKRYAQAFLDKKKENS